MNLHFFSYLKRKRKKIVFETVEMVYCMADRVEFPAHTNIWHLLFVVVGIWNLEKRYHRSRALATVNSNLLFINFFLFKSIWDEKADKRSKLLSFFMISFKKGKKEKKIQLASSSFSYVFVFVFFFFLIIINLHLMLSFS